MPKLNRATISSFALAALFVVTLLVSSAVRPAQTTKAADRIRRNSALVPQSSNAVALSSKVVVNTQSAVDHGWRLLEQLTPSLVDPKPFPRWMDPSLGWYRRCGTDLLNITCPVSGPQNQLLSPAFPSKSPQVENGTQHSGIRLSLVFYNAQAADWVKKNQLVSGSELEGELGKSNASIPAFPEKSMVVKAI
jgi:hypothetical protein